MAQNNDFYIHIDGQLIPVTEEIYLAYYRSERRMRYFERDIKTESAVRDKDGNITGYKPAKEDSLERLMDAGEDYADDSHNAEDDAIRAVMIEIMRDALCALTNDERKLIDALFFKGMSERQAAAAFGLSQKAINKRKTKILAKLRKKLTSKSFGTHIAPANGK
jgi:RNA polymerase sigma factor (sigma-70 family)